MLSAAYLIFFSAFVFLIYTCIAPDNRTKKQRASRGRRKDSKMAFRIIRMFNNSLKSFYKVSFLQDKLDSLAKQLEMAGLTDDYTAEEYLTFHFIGGLTGFFLTCLVMIAVFTSDSADANIFHILVLGIIFTGSGFAAPTLKLNEIIKTRKKAILRDLPFTLDLITVSVEAGLDFGGAIQRITEHAEMNELNYEFSIFLNETRLGKRKIEALQRMSDRIDIPVVSSILASLIQAEELGMRIGQILRIQSQSLRTKRMQFAEKMALEAPVKMLIPLAIFIFPAVFIVLLGPMIIQFISR